jgi:hypothetical protein
MVGRFLLALGGTGATAAANAANAIVIRDAHTSAGSHGRAHARA